MDGRQRKTFLDGNSLFQTEFGRSEDPISGLRDIFRTAKGPSEASHVLINLVLLIFLLAFVILILN